MGTEENKMRRLTENLAVAKEERMHEEAFLSDR